ncbi:MAG: efflux RND transporter periplasmic adaptor subunit [Myxococcaceae bacterium]
MRSLAVCSFVTLAACGIACKGTPPVEYETAEADRGKVVAKVTATGTLSALVTVQVGAQVSGRIAQLFVDFNSPVKQGDILAKMDAQLFVAAVQQARANHMAAQGNLARARAEAKQAGRELARTRALSARDLVAPADLDASRAAAEAQRATVRAAEGSLAQSQAALEQAETNLAYTTIVSPIDGVVISRAVDVGQTVAATLQAPTLFTLAKDLRQMQVDTNVAESDVGKLQPGMSATFRVDAFPGEHFEGLVRQIRNAPQTVQNVVTYDAVIDVANPQEKLRPGMTANVTFIYASREGVLRVPNAALRYRPPPGKTDAGTQRESPPKDARTVHLLRDGQPQPVSVVTGITDGSFTEVVSGELREGDKVITETRGGATAPGARQPPAGMPGPRRMF